MVARPAFLALVLVVPMSLSVLLFPPLSVQAADKNPIDATLDACLEKNGTTIGMRQCLDQAYKAWDGELNAAYKNVMASLSPEAKAALKTAQRNWIAFKDAELAFYRSVFASTDGTIWPVVESRYVIDLFRKRAIELRCSATMTDMAGPADPQCP